MFAIIYLLATFTADVFRGQAFETITAKAMKNATNVSETNLTWKWTTEDPSKGPPWYIPYAQ